MAKKQEIYDEELIAQIRNGNKDAEILLLERYRKYSNIVAAEFKKSNYLVGVTVDDLFSVAFAAVQKAISNFTNLSASFYPYWKSIVLKEFTHFIKEYAIKLDSKKDVIYLDETFGDNDTSFAEVIGHEDASIDYSILENELINTINSEVIGLSNIQKKIIGLRLLGESNNEIAKELGLSRRKIYYHLNVIREKLRNITVH